MTSSGQAEFEKYDLKSSLVNIYFLSYPRMPGI